MSEYLALMKKKRMENLAKPEPDKKAPKTADEKLEEKNRYQTVYAENYGSSAAPTAGLHFTEELLEKIKEVSEKHNTIIALVENNINQIKTLYERNQIPRP